jgi:hypothetical protein|tara:strand:- start:156 stop:1388 length:1233 start_codon:yes stop_codon:yes gene_type:complete
LVEILTKLKMKNMKRNTLLVSFLTVLIVMTVGFVSAGDLAVVGSLSTEFNGVSLDDNLSLSAVVGDVVPVRVLFTAVTNASDVVLEVSMNGFRSDVSVETGEFDVIAGKSYTKLLSLKLPDDIKDLTRDYALYVELSSPTDKTEKSYTITLQRESNFLDILSVDYSSKVFAGSVFPISIVVENNGYNNAEDIYVIVSIPELGVSTRGFIGDLDSIENYNNDNHEEDSVEEMVYLKIPDNALNGIYDLVVEVYNDDSSTIVEKLISIDGSASTILAADKAKDLNAGESVIYEMIIVNSADDVKVFNIETLSGAVLDVSAPSVVTVGPDSSKTISIVVTAANNAEIGTYTFSVDVEGKQVVFGANVVGSSVSASTVALTVILVIIFLVLLAVLVVLLTRKEKPMEEVETSYY